MPTAAATRALGPAVSVGPALPRGELALRLIGVHREALNFLSGDGFVLSLTGPSGAGSPEALALALPRDFRSLGLEPGAQATLRERSLAIESGAEALLVEWEEGARAEPPRLHFPRAAESAFDACGRELGRIQREKGTLLRFEELLETAPEREAEARPIVEGASLLAEGARLLADGAPPLVVGARPSLGRALGLLVGTGPGLSPAGDDFLCGLLAALGPAAAAGEPGPTALLAGLEEELGSLLPRTTALSASTLRLALRGLFASELAELSRALDQDDRAAAVSALRSLCRRGHSSGADTASGYLFGLRFAWSRRPSTPTPAAARGGAARRQHAS